MYALLSGHLRIHPDMDPDAITVLEPGEIVGELSVIDGQATSMHVVAEGECRVLGIDENTAWGLMRTSHNVAYNLIKVLAQRLRGGNSVISSARSCSVNTSATRSSMDLPAFTIDASWMRCSPARWSVVGKPIETCPS